MSLSSSTRLIWRKFDELRVIASNPEIYKTNFTEHNGMLSEVHGLLQRCKDLARKTKARRPGDGQFPDNLKDSFPSRDVADSLKDAYFRNFESAYRILHVPSFQSDYEKYWNNPAKTEDGLVITISLVMAIGACFDINSDHGEQLRSNALSWIYAAQSWLLGPIQKSRLSIVSLQVHCLLLLARQTNFVGPDLVWISAGSLLRTAIHLGLHRDPTKYSKTSPFHTEIRRRLWATILEMTIQTSLDCGMPSLISFEDFDTLAPSNIAEAELLETTTEFPLIRSEVSFTQTSLQIGLLKSLPVRLEVARLINHFRSNPSYEDILRLSSEVLEGVRESAVRMRAYLSSSDITKPSIFHQNLIEHLIRRFLLALHRPFAIKARKDPRYYFSRKVCLEQALVIASPQSDDDFSRLMAIGGGIFREILTHGALTLGLELITQLQEDDRNMVLQRNRPRREPIYEAIRGIIDLTRERLRLGETNVKGLLVLSMAIGQSESMEAGNSPEEGILLAAKQSALTGFEILKARLPPGTAVSEPSSQDSVVRDSLSGDVIDGLEQDRGLESLLDSVGIDLNLEDSASWLFPAFDEIPWASMEYQ